MNSEFTGKRVLVTGASRGLGSVAATAFARRGARVLITGRTTEKLEAVAAGFPERDRHAVFAADLLEPAGIAALAEFATAEFGAVDIVFHAMGGGYGFREPLLTWDQSLTLYKVNVAAGAELNRLLMPGLAAGGEGRIIHVGSVASTDASASVGYNTVKAALAAYVRSLGRELAGKGVVVTGILPGAFYAPENSWRRLEATKPEVVGQFIDQRLPRGRIAEAEEMLPLIFLLAGPGASMMAGSCVAIDAGEAVAYTAP